MQRQRTLRQVIGCAGVGLHSGARVALTLRPAAEGTGIRFRRVDRPGSATIATHPENADTIDGVICLGDAPGRSVRRVDHLLAALAACEIDNVLIDLSGTELPAMDGTPRPFMLLIECAGAVDQSRPVPCLGVVRSVEVVTASGRARLEPGVGLEFAIEQPDDATYAVSTSIGGIKAALFGGREPRRSRLSPAGRERGRAAVLDALGALALIPARISGRYVECCADADLRCALARELLADPASYRLSTPLPLPPAAREAGRLVRYG